MSGEMYSLRVLSHGKVTDLSQGFNLGKVSLSPSLYVLRPLRWTQMCLFRASASVTKRPVIFQFL